MHSWWFNLQVSNHSYHHHCETTAN